MLYETDTASDIADEVEAIAKVLFDNPKAEMLTVEQVQDLVEDYLMRSERRDVAQAHSLMLLEKNLQLQMFKIKMLM